MSEEKKEKMFRIYRDELRVWSCFYECNAVDILKCLSVLYPDSDFALKYE